MAKLTKPLTAEDIDTMRRCEHVGRIIPNAAIRSRLKRWGYIEAWPQTRKYRHMPYGLTEAGRAALASATDAEGE